MKNKLLNTRRDFMRLFYSLRILSLISLLLFFYKNLDILGNVRVIEKIEYDSNGNYIEAKEEGVTKRYYENGQLAFEGEMKSFQKNGICKYYHENGQLKIIGNWKSDIPHGIFKRYNKKGNLEAEGKYEQGYRVGLFKGYYTNGKLAVESNWKNGELKDINYYDKNMKIVDKINWKDEKKVNILEIEKIIFENSYIYYEFISPDSFSGIVEEIDNSLGTLKFRNEISLKDGKLSKMKIYQNENLKEEIILLEDGSINTEKYRYGDLYFEKISNQKNDNFTFKEYYEDNKIREEGFFNYFADGGREEGSKIYKENGKLEIESNFIYERGSDKKSGEINYYKENGKIEKIEKFSKGEIIETIVQN